MLAQRRWKIGPPNLRHYSPKVIRASSSFKRCRSVASRDSVSRFTSEKKRSFSASLDCRPTSIKSTSTRFALVLRLLANARTRRAIPVGIETLCRTAFCVSAMPPSYTALHQSAPPSAAAPELSRDPDEQHRREPADARRARCWARDPTACRTQRAQRKQ